MKEAAISLLITITSTLLTQYASAEDFTQEVLEEYKRQKHQAVSEAHYLDGQDMLSEAISKHVMGMASRPPIACTFKVFMNERGFVDLLQMMQCPVQIAPAIYSGLHDHHMNLTRYKNNRFNHAREVSFGVVVHEPQKAHITMKHTSKTR